MNYYNLISDYLLFIIALLSLPLVLYVFMLFFIATINTLNFIGSIFERISGAK
jgi:hypothetical protein